MRRILLLFCVAFLPLSAPAQRVEDRVPPPTTGYMLQLGSFRDAANAQAALQAFTQEGYRPLSTVKPSDGMTRILFGPIESGAEAWGWQEDLRAKGRTAMLLPAGRDAVWPEQPADGPMASLFGLDGKTLADVKPASLKGNPEYERLEALDKPGGEAAYGAALRSALPRVDKASPLRGYIVANLGSLAMKQDRLEEAKQMLGSVATGAVPAPANVRLMAMRRYAWVVHVQGDRSTAWRAYREIARRTDSRDLKDTCAVELAGLSMELAESGKGTHDEARHIMARAFSSIDAKKVKPRATLELMYTETWARQPGPDFAKAAEQSDALVARLDKLADPALRPELVGAIQQSGRWHFKNQAYDKAMPFFERVLKEFPEDKQYWRGYDPRAHAIYFSGYAEAAMGRLSALREARREARRDVLRYFPDCDLAKDIRNWNPEDAQAVDEELARERAAK